MSCWSRSRCPSHPGEVGSSVQKFTKRAIDWAIVGVAVQGGAVALVNMASTPVRAAAVERALAGGAGPRDAAAHAAEGTSPVEDINATPAYREHLARVLTGRALEETGRAGTRLQARTSRRSQPSYQSPVPCGSRGQPAAAAGTGGRARRFRAGRITAEQLRAAEDTAVAAAVAMQEAVGLQSVTDGEFRRASWHMDFIYQLGGISQARGNLAVKFHNPCGDIEFTPASIVVDSKVRMDQTIFAADFRYLRSVAGPSVAKLTIPSPNMVHYRGGRASVDPGVYPDMEEFWADLAAAYADEVARLAGLGCPSLQLDDTCLAYLNDPVQRAEIAARGENADQLHLRYIGQVNAALAGPPAGMAVTTHLCRGVSGPRGRRRGAMTSWPRRCSAGWTWMGSSWSSMMSTRAGSRRCGSCRRARWWCWAW